MGNHTLLTRLIPSLFSAAILSCSNEAAYSDETKTEALTQGSGEEGETTEDPKPSDGEESSETETTQKEEESPETEPLKVYLDNTVDLSLLYGASSYYFTSERTVHYIKNKRSYSFSVDSGAVTALQELPLSTVENTQFALRISESIAWRVTENTEEDNAAALQFMSITEENTKVETVGPKLEKNLGIPDTNAASYRILHVHPHRVLLSSESKLTLLTEKDLLIQFKQFPWPNKAETIVKAPVGGGTNQDNTVIWHVKDEKLFLLKKLSGDEVKWEYSFVDLDMADIDKLTHIQATITAEGSLQEPFIVDVGSGPTLAWLSQDKVGSLNLTLTPPNE